MKSDQTGFGAVEGLLLLALVGIIISVGLFVYKSQQATNSTLDTSIKSQTETQGIKPKTTDRYLEIKEWGIKLQLTSKIEDAYYNLEGDTIINISARRLDELKNSKPYCIFVQFPIQKARVGDKLNGQVLAEEDLMKRSRQVNGYYYVNASPPPPPCSPQITPVVAEIQAIAKDLRIAIKEVETL